MRGVEVATIASQILYLVSKEQNVIRHKAEAFKFSIEDN